MVILDMENANANQDTINQETCMMTVKNAIQDAKSVLVAVQRIVSNAQMVLNVDVENVHAQITQFGAILLKNVYQIK